MKMKIILEAIRKKKVVRKGKIQWKKFTTREGYKVINGKEVRILPQEKRRRLLAARRTAVKRRTHQASINRARKKSMKKRYW
jgi:hypothetical protein